MKKIVSILLIAMMLVGSIGVIANAEEANDFGWLSSLVTDIADITPDPAIDRTAWPVLTVEVFDRAESGFNMEDCMQLKYVQKNFGDPNQIVVKFKPVARWSEGDVLTTQMAGQEAADICITYSGDKINNWIDDEAIVALDKYLDEYGQNIKAFLGDALLDFGRQDKDEDGVKEQYFIPARRMNVANVGNFIRGDWLKKLNMAKPTTIAEFEEFCIKAKEANLGGELTIPIDFDLYEPDPLYNVKRYTDAFIDFTQVSEEDWVAYSLNHEMLPGSKEGYRWLNKMYHLGAIDDTFATNNDQANDSYKVLGYFGHMSQQPDQPWRTDKAYEAELEKNVPGAYWTAVNCFQNDSLGGKYLHDIYNANGLSIFIPYWVEENNGVKTPERVINAIKYLDWMCQVDNMRFLQNGIIGVNYLAIRYEGIPIQQPDKTTIPDEYKMHAGDVCFIANGLYFGSDEKNNAAIAMSFTGYEEEVKESYNYAMSDTWTQVSYTVPIQAETDYLTMVKSKQGEFLVNVITCAAEDFDAVFDKGIQDILNTGAQEIIDEHRAAYAAGNIRGSFPGAAE